MSTGTTGAIRAGAAYVQAYLDDNPLTQGLAKLQTKIKTWQVSLSKMAAGTMGGELPEPFAAMARFATSPAGAFSALLGAAKYTADAREEILKMSEATGVGVEKLSAFAYAARRADVSNQALASGLRKLQSKEFAETMQAAMGGKGKIQFAKALGVDSKADAVDQFRQISKEFEKLDAVSRVGLAKKLGITELLPLLNVGIAGLDAFTERAKKLGLVVSEEDAKAGDQFNMSFRDLHEVLMSSVKAIGGALVPVITGLTNIVVKVVVAVRDWIKEHPALTQAIFYGSAAIVSAGFALKGFSIFLGMAGKAVTAFQFIVKGLRLTFSLVSGAIGMLPLLCNPAVLAIAGIGAALIGTAAYIGYQSGAFSNLGKQWQGFKEDTSSSIKAISNAIAKGDLQAAWTVVTAYASLEWARLVDTLQTAWEGFMGWFADRLDEMLKEWARLTGGIHHSQKEMYEAGAAGGVIGGVAASLGTPETQEQTSQRIKDFLKANPYSGPSGDAQAARRKDLENKMKALSVAQAAANAPGEGDTDNPNKKPFDAMQAAETRGTFSASVAAMMGSGGNVAQQQLDAQIEEVEQHRRTNDLIENLIEVNDETTDQIAAMIQAIGGVQ